MSMLTLKLLHKYIFFEKSLIFCKKRFAFTKINDILKLEEQFPAAEELHPAHLELVDGGLFFYGDHNLLRISRHGIGLLPVR